MSTLSDKFVVTGIPGDTAVTNLKGWYGQGTSCFTRAGTTDVTDNKKCTIAAWYKRPEQSEGQGEGQGQDPIFGFGTQGSGSVSDIILYASQYFASTAGTGEDMIHFRVKVSGTETVDLRTRFRLRDASQWTHICASYDSTQSTESNRVKIWINGERQTQFSHATYPSQNTVLPTYNGETFHIGRLGSTQSSGAFHEGGLCDIYFVDGAMVDPLDNFIKRSSFQGLELYPVEYDSANLTGNSFHLKFGDKEGTNTQFYLRPITPHSRIGVDNSRSSRVAPIENTGDKTNYGTTYVRTDNWGVNANFYDGYGDVWVGPHAGNPYASSDRSLLMTSVGTTYGHGGFYWNPTTATDYPRSFDGTTGSGDFAISCWTYKDVNDIIQYETITSAGYGVAGGILIQNGGTALGPCFYDAGNYALRPAVATVKYKWEHHVWGRKDGHMMYMVNGEIVDHYYQTRDFNLGSAWNWYVGYKGQQNNGTQDNYPYSWQGLLEDYRYIHGSGTFDEYLPMKELSGQGHWAVPKSEGNSTGDAYATISMKNPADGGKFGGSMEFTPHSDHVTNGSWLEIGDSTDWDLGSSSFTIEFWIKAEDLTYTYGQSILSQSTEGAASDSSWLVWLTSSGTIEFYTSNTSQNDWETAIATTSALTASTWHHVAFVRSGDTLTPYVDGTAGTAGSFSSGFSIPSSSRNLQIARQECAATSRPHFLEGRLQDIRIIKGSAVTPPADGPTEALTAVTNTKLLLHAENVLPTERSADATGTKLLIQMDKDDTAITDKSSEEQTITTVGPMNSGNNSGASHIAGVQVGWNGSTPHEASTDQHSLAIIGTTNDTHSLSSSNNMTAIATAGSSSPSNGGPTLYDNSFGTSKFTLEGWFYSTAWSSNSLGTFICGVGDHPAFSGASQEVSWGLYLDGDKKLRFGYSNNGDDTSNTFPYITTAHASVAASLHTWHHFAVCGDGTNIRVYLDGSGTSSTQNSIADNTHGMELGAIQYGGGPGNTNNGESYRRGDGHLYLVDFSFARGVANYVDSSLSVPTSVRSLYELEDATVDSARNGAFTTSGAIRLVRDTPKKGSNYNTMNVFDDGTDATSNLMTGCGLILSKKITGSINTIAAVWGASPQSDTKYYWEILALDPNNDQQYIGVIEHDTYPMTGKVATNDTSWGAITQTNVSCGWLGHDAPPWTQSNHFTSTTASGDVFMLALDAKNGKLWLGKNGTWGSGDPAAGTSPAFSNLNTDAHSITPAVSQVHVSGASDCRFIMNFGQAQDFLSGKTGYDTSQSEFYHAPPSGFVSMCAENAPADIAVPKKNFDIKVYNGGYDPDMSSGGDTTVSGLQFQPAIIWTRPLDGVQSDNGSNGYEGNYIFDSVIGFGNGGMNIDGNNATSYAQLNSMETGIDSVSSSGFVASGEETNYAQDSLGEGGSPDNPERYAAWCWKLGKTGSSYSGSGADPDTEHYSDETGISIVAKDNTSGTIGSNLILNHSLGKKPKFAIAWDINQEFYVAGHYVYHHNLASEKFLKLNTDAAETAWGNSGDGSAAGNLPPFPSSPSTTTTFKVGDAINKTNLHMYLFAEIDGFSKFGYLKGTGSAPNYIPLGFKPRFIMIKRIDSTNHWYIYDTERDKLESIASRWARANDNDSEATAGTAGHYIDFVGNGVVIRNTSAFDNDSSGEYIYAAFADKPWKYSRGTGGA